MASMGRRGRGGIVSKIRPREAKNLSKDFRYSKKTPADMEFALIIAKNMERRGSLAFSLETPDIQGSDVELAARVNGWTSPTVLAMIEDRIDLLSTIFGCPKHETIDMMMKNPALINLDMAHASRCIVRLSELLPETNVGVLVRLKNELLLWDYGMELAEATAASLVKQKKTPSDIIPYFHYVITATQLEGDWRAAIEDSYRKPDPALEAQAKLVAAQVKASMKNPLTAASSLRPARSVLEHMQRFADKKPISGCELDREVQLAGGWASPSAATLLETHLGELSSILGCTAEGALGMVLSRPALVAVDYAHLTNCTLTLRSLLPGLDVAHLIQSKPELVLRADAMERARGAVRALKAAGLDPSNAIRENPLLLMAAKENVANLIAIIKQIY
eukprot:CAMPEP_0198205702 /NCGR_PEP_ID=MMETSP1445-20131203/9235_1 /TAXON_ID=36898 /ORGANISM="Pyramimonas sp., Strain CCMP2087" /LENGTH=390 /DNA_ID=CAMNT_0043878099 /DNA_START=116 /DNA_END=1288 /DNA_ORIENTATION=+